MLESYLRKALDDTFFRPLIRLIQRYTRCKPIHLTGAASLLGPVIILCIGKGHPYMACMALWLSGLFDVLDGELARSTQTASMVGAVMDIVSDRWLESCVLVALLMVEPTERAWPVLLMSLSVLLCVTSFLVVGIHQTNSGHKSFHYSPGLMERAEAFIFFSLMFIWPEAFEILAWIFVALVMWTGWDRLNTFVRQAVLEDTVVRSKK